MVQLQDLSLQQLKFSLAGMTNSPTWTAMEKKMSITKQCDCIEALAREKNPESIVKQMIVAKRMQMARNR